MKIRNHKLIPTLLLTAALSTLAHAAPITGGIDIAAYGSFVLLDKVLNTVDIVTAPSNGTGFNAQVALSTLNVASLPAFGSLGNYNDFTYSPLIVADPLWTFGAVTFSLTQITSINEVGAGLVLLGTGTIKAIGYDDTLGTWSFSADTSSQGATFSWSSTATADVPDGGTSMSFLGLSLLGLAGVAKKLRKK